MLQTAEGYQSVSKHDKTMMTSSNGDISALLAIGAGNSPVPVNSPHKGQWRGALAFSLICVWINGWVNIRETGDLRRYRAHYDVTVMPQQSTNRVQNYRDALHISVTMYAVKYRSMAKCKKDVTPVREQWSYVFLALPNRDIMSDLGCNWL